MFFWALVFLSYLLNVINSVTYPSMTCAEDGSLNSANYDQPVTWYKSNYFLNGMESEHSNSKEDRIFRMRYCRTNSNYGVTSSQTLPDTDYDSTFVRGCGGGSAIYYGYSVHSNSKEDRTFKFKCGYPNTNYILNTNACGWYGWYPSEYDGDIDWNCPNNGVIRTIQSQHSNYHEDRQFEFECCRIMDNPYTFQSMSCSQNSDYTNEYDGSHDNEKTGYFLNGLYSIHSNAKEDRRFKWRYCKPNVSGNGYTSTTSLSLTSYDAAWTRTCRGYNNGNAAIIYGTSEHSNSKEDRIWKFYCGYIDSTKYFLDNCGWTGELNTWDDVVNFNCPQNGIIRAIYSIHDNSKEDRLWKFECCNMFSVTNRRRRLLDLEN